jgi:hypothetical protein
MSNLGEKTIPILIIALAFCACGIGCGGDEIGEPPVIDQFLVPEAATIDNEVTFQVIAHDTDGDALTYAWTVDGSPIVGNQATISWTPTEPGTVTVQVTISDGKGTPVTEIRSLQIKEVATIQEIWVDYNVFSGIVKGMRIHVKFTIDDRKGREGQVIAHFFFDNGQKLEDFNGSYTTVGGQVAVGDTFRPRFVSSIYEDFELFMPYEELHLGVGEHDLKFSVSIFDVETGTLLTLSDNEFFTFTRE